MCDTVLGHCVFTDIVCGPYAGNCTVSLCQIGDCNTEFICPSNLLGQNALTSGGIAGVVVAVVVGTALLAVALYVGIRILRSSRRVEEEHGGTAASFAAE